jgi:hypothetical protein
MTDLSVVVGMAAAAALVAGGAPAAADSARTNARASEMVFFVHGHAEGTPAGKDCVSTWGNALDYFEERGWGRESMKTVGYYTGDENCDVTISGASNGTRIRNLAADFAKHVHQYNTSTGKPVDVVAHSMGGLITRVALLGSAKGWEGFPPNALDIGDVVTLGTPPSGRCRGNQERRHPVEVDELPRVGVHENVARTGEPVERNLYRGDYRLRYWNASDDQSHDTTNGWAPLETAYNAIARNDER